MNESISKSLWQTTQDLNQFKSLNGNAKTDVLIIGGGICGLLCAYFLHQEGVPYILAEADKICSGNTGNTTAKITSQHNLIYDKLISSIGLEQANLYLDANQDAIKKYHELSKIYPCDFEEKPAGVYSLTDRRTIEKEVKAMHILGFPARFADTLPLPFLIQGAVIFPKQAQFHPLKFLAGISQNLNIYEHTFVKGIDGHNAYTDNGKITADKIIVATHFPMLNKRGCYFMKLYQRRSYVIALKGAKDVGGMYIDGSQNGLSFRNHGDLLLLGGGGGRTGRKNGGYKVLRSFAKSAYPTSMEMAHWAAQDCISLDHIPYIGEYSTHTPGLYTATGFNKWGMSTAMVAATLLTDLVMDRKNPYQALFSPSRSMLKPQLFVNGLATTFDFLTPTAKRCSHLGCALKWNPIEHSWDCPCHGSRFAEDGKLMDNPALKDINLP